MTSEPGKKQLQYTYCQISYKVKAIRQWNFGQSIEHNMRNVFLERCSLETIPRPFS